MAINGVNNFNSTAQTFNTASALVKDALNLAKELNGGNAAAALQNAGTMFQDLSKIVGGSTGNTNAAQSAPMNKAADMAKLFGNGPDAEREKAAADAKAAAEGGGEMSLGKILALIGGLLVKAINGTLAKLAEAAKSLDAASEKGGPTASMNQKIQELSTNLQQIQSTLGRVNETISNLIKSNNDTQSVTTRNISA